MSDPRRDRLSVGGLSIAPSAAPEKWEVRAQLDGAAVEAHWGEWVRLARRILDTDALSRDREARGDAWDQGHAAGADPEAASEAVNPYR
ncbi:hypothetical protein DEA06_02155 [Microbacterium sp. Gd 4-13]|uniref:hypothetical protein n=1 Tax=Microbacterium sp. Gd 4-13 TaxID=2173179 RepID=UPI000D576D1C|nr:hypothetical protein [Microbacterium sp. Gd 4-13]PVW06357.1 hypothetical protein DEA06_02155 [Microbacterium sp. Gd 4-13]